MAFRYARPVELLTTSVSPYRAGGRKQPVLASRLREIDRMASAFEHEDLAKRGRSVIETWSDTLATNQTFRYAVLQVEPDTAVPADENSGLTFSRYSV